MAVWRGAERKQFRSWPKDVGHELACLQPFNEDKREWSEVVVSSLVMLHVAEMVRAGKRVLEISIRKDIKTLVEGKYL